MPAHNCTAYAFNAHGSNKWKYSGRGFASAEMFNGRHGVEDRRTRFLKDNGGRFPGMSSAAADYVWVIICDESCDHGWPLMLPPLTAVSE